MTTIKYLEVLQVATTIYYRNDGDVRHIRLNISFI
jgi:hypothetical protein